MNLNTHSSSNIVDFTKPENLTNEEWYAIDFNDPLMAVC